MGKKHKAPKRAKQHGGGGGGGSVKLSKAKTRTRSAPHTSTPARKRRPPTRAPNQRRVTSSGAYRFIEAPPRKDMKRKSPDSAPRLYAWMVSEGYAEPVNSSATSRSNRRTRGR